MDIGGRLHIQAFVGHLWMFVILLGQLMSIVKITRQEIETLFLNL